MERMVLTRRKDCKKIDKKWHTCSKSPTCLPPGWRAHRTLDILSAHLIGATGPRYHPLLWPPTLLRKILFESWFLTQPFQYFGLFLLGSPPVLLTQIYHLRMQLLAIHWLWLHFQEHQPLWELAVKSHKILPPTCLWFFFITKFFFKQFCIFVVFVFIILGICERERACQ